MDQTLHIGGHQYRLIGAAPLSSTTRACYGKRRYTLERVADGSLWESFGARLTPAAQLVRRGIG